MPTTSITSLRKAAIVLESLDPQAASGLVARLEPRQAAAVHICRPELAAVDEGERTAALREFAELARARSKSRQPTFLRSSDKLPAAASLRPFHFLQGVDVHALVELLEDELPQTIALVVSHLPRQRGLEIVARLSGEKQALVTARIASLGPHDPAVVHDVADLLAARILGLADCRRSA